MGKSKGESNSKKAQGQARKAEANNKKKHAEQEKLEKLESEQWEEGAKGSNKKKLQEAEKKAEAARKKAEREALLASEEASLPSKPLKSKNRGAEKVAARRAGNIDQAFEKVAGLNATGIDDALDALSLTTKNDSKKIDRHPERRFKAAYEAYEARKLPELKESNPGLRLNQMKFQIRKEFEKSPENPFNQVHADYNATGTDLQGINENIKRATEHRLAHK